MSREFNTEWLTAREMRMAKNKPEASSEGVKIERELHDDVQSELRHRRWYFVHSRMDRKTTTQLGVVDFIIAIPGGKTLWLELKRKNGKLSQEQNITRHILKSSGHWHEVAFSMTDVLRILDDQERTNHESK